MKDKKLLRKIIEGALLAAGQPLAIKRLQELFVVTEDDEEDHGLPSKEDLQAVLEDIQADCRDRGYELLEVGTGWRFQVIADTARWVNRLWDEKPQKYSRSLLETLSLIAYRQPVTRGDIEGIRGVAVSSYIIKTLTEREWVKVVGHRDVPGRPALYATTRLFLDYFNLTSLDQLPSLREIADLESINPELSFDDGMEIPPTKDLSVDPDGDREAVEELALAEDAERSGNSESGDLDVEAQDDLDAELDTDDSEDDDQNEDLQDEDGMGSDEPALLEPNVDDEHAEDFEGVISEQRNDGEDNDSEGEAVELHQDEQNEELDQDESGHDGMPNDELTALEKSDDE